MWEQIRSNQTRTLILVAAMGLLLLLLGYFLGEALFGSGIGGLVVAILIWVIMNLFAYFQGDSLILSISRARKISRDDHPRLYNIVEEMKIASGLEKVPDIYIIDDPSLNAFAVGRDPSRASVAITSGLLERLNRDELQGVMAHEISHIKNRDVLLMTFCSVLLGTIVLLAWFAARMMLFGGMRGGGSRRSSGGGGGYATLIIIAVAIVLLIVAPIAAQLIYYAISRRREYLADASGALYTRYPEGLASALEKIAGSTQELKTANKAFAPMYIINPFRDKGRAASDLTSTHPPVSERVRILRSMAGGASLAAYDKAYHEVSRSGKGVIPSSALVGAAAVAARKPEAAEAVPEKVERVRETSDLLWKYSDYGLVNCECGTKLRVPPKFRGDSIRCPHCGRTNTIPARRKSTG
ncbi:MAG: peptidase M28 [Chloroflexi bacterium RBG_13_53_26]|nr:MAG: peptidase M28 [Chloroflexi bacterium RBG_13_53_26]